MANKGLRGVLALALTLFVGCTVAWAATTHAAQAPTTQAAHHDDHYPAYDHPTLPKPHTTWAGLMVLIVLGMFVAAAAVGMVVMLNLPDEPPPPADAHDDHAGGHHADPHHGHH